VKEAEEEINEGESESKLTVKQRIAKNKKAIKMNNEVTQAE
jgi:hypothetical protein